MEERQYFVPRVITDEARTRLDGFLDLFRQFTDSKTPRTREELEVLSSNLRKFYEGLPKKETE